MSKLSSSFTSTCNLLTTTNEVHAHVEPNLAFTPAKRNKRASHNDMSKFVDKTISACKGSGKVMGINEVRK